MADKDTRQGPTLPLPWQRLGNKGGLPLGIKDDPTEPNYAWQDLGLPGHGILGANSNPKAWVPLTPSEEAALANMKDLEALDKAPMPNLHDLSHMTVFDKPATLTLLNKEIDPQCWALLANIPEGAEIDDAIHNGAQITPEMRKQLKQQLAAGQLFELTFKARTFRHIYPNANFVRFRDEDIDKLFASFAGEPFLRDHYTYSISSRDGTITASMRDDLDLIQEINITTHRGLTSFAEGQIDRFSIGWYWSSITCSVCGNDWYDWRNCSHWPGRTYEIRDDDDKKHEVLCEIIFENPRGKETSAVNVPAVQDTGLLSALHQFAERKDALHEHQLKSKETFIMGDQITNQDNQSYTGTASSSTSATTTPAAAPAAQQDAQEETPTTLTDEERAELDALRKYKEEQSELAALRRFKADTLAAQPEADKGKDTAGQQQYIPNEQIDALNQALAENKAWKEAMRESATAEKLNAAGLSPSVQTIIMAQMGAIGDYSLEDLDSAIEKMKDALADELKLHTVKDMHPNSIGNRIIGVSDGLDTIGGHVEWALGVQDAKLPPPNQRSLSDMYQHVTGDFEWRQEFNEDYSLANANTDTFSGMVVNALNKNVEMHYNNQTEYKWFEMIVDVLAHDASTQPLQLIMVDGTGLLPTVAEGGTYLEMQVGDSKETMDFEKKGAFVGITIEMIRKSQIARLRAIPKNLVNSCVRTRSNTIANIFKQNSGAGPTLVDDNTALFHADHGNVATAAFSASAWAAARERIWKQKIPGQDGGVLSLWPRYVLLPIGLYDTALSMFGMGAGNVGRPASGNQAQEVNPYAVSRTGDPRPMPIAVPEFTDSNDWAYICDPMNFSPIKMAYANSPQGMEHPMPEIYQVRSQTSGLVFTNDELPIKIRDWFSFGVSTYHGVGKNNVP